MIKIRPGAWASVAAAAALAFALGGCETATPYQPFQHSGIRSLEFT